MSPARTTTITTLWDRQIRHITRTVKPTRLSSLRGRLLKAEVRRRRGVPSRNLPLELVFEMLRLRRDKRTDDPEVRAARDRLERACIRDRLLELKRRQRHAARHRARPSAKQTRIYLWRRRRDWLRDAEARMEQMPD